MTRALIVDDEAPARRMVRDALAAMGATGPDGQIEVVGECANGPEAVAAVADAETTRQPIGLLFLDVQMPGLTGFEVLEALRDRGLTAPAVVFSTAFDQHAVRAFEVAAVDYLLKPFTQARFEEAVGRALATDADPTERVVETVRQSGARFAERLLVEDGGVFVPVATADVLWAEAAGDYTKLHTLGKTYLASQGIGALTERLDPDRFARVHRSTIVALDALRALERDNSGGFVARLADGAVVRVSRTYADTIRDMMA
ncbi:MAG: LytTR family DNA-binding domain-containing protein [Bacteroidota bacterium]